MLQFVNMVFKTSGRMNILDSGLLSPGSPPVRTAVRKSATVAAG
jgi:hypothetical protein